MSYELVTRTVGGEEIGRLTLASWAQAEQWARVISRKCGLGYVRQGARIVCAYRWGIEIEVGKQELRKDQPSNLTS